MIVFLSSYYYEHNWKNYLATDSCKQETKSYNFYLLYMCFIKLTKTFELYKIT